MSVVEVETQEDKLGSIGKENVDDVPLDRTATAYLVVTTPSIVW